MLQYLDRLITDMKLEVITHSHALAMYFDFELHAVCGMLSTNCRFSRSKVVVVYSWRVL